VEVVIINEWSEYDESDRNAELERKRELGGPHYPPDPVDPVSLRCDECGRVVNIERDVVEYRKSRGYRFHLCRLCAARKGENPWVLTDAERARLAAEGANYIEELRRERRERLWTQTS